MTNVKKLQIADINIAIHSEFDFDLSDKCKIFEANFEKADIYFILNFSYRIELNGYSLVYQNGLFEYYTCNNKFIKISYVDWKKKKIDWYSVHEKLNNIHYIYYLNDFEKNRFKINPLYYVDITNFFIQNNAMVLHSSLIDFNGNGIIFSAPSGTGKSTQANLWNKYKNAIILNGDRSIIRKLDDYYAYGSPYAGSSDIYLNKKVRIKAIIVLKQAPYNKISRLDYKHAFLHILSEMSLTTWNKNFINLEITFLKEVIENIPVYLLECLPNEEAVNLVFDKLRGDFDGY